MDSPRRRPRAWLAALLAAAACAAPEDVTAPEPPCEALSLSGVPADVNLVFVLNDTMRRDRVGSYGGPARTPVFDRFAEEHLLFERAFSQAPWTVPSIATLFTSLYPSQHGVTSHPRDQFAAHAPLRKRLRSSDVLADAYVTLAEVLRAAGFRTAAFVSNPWMDSRFGFAQGFERYEDRFARWGVPGVEVSRAALAWIRSLEPGERFFAYVHTIDSHRPYGALDWHETLARAQELRSDPRELTPEQREEVAPIVRFEGEGAKQGALLELSPALLELAYDKGIEQFDAALGVLLDGLAALPAWERTAVVVTSDHGEAFYDRGYGNHGSGLYDDELAVPLAARLPGAAPPSGRIGCAVGLIDLLPSLCDYVGAGCPDAAAGTSLFAGPGRVARYVVGEGVMDRPPHRSIRNASWKLLYEPLGSPVPRVKRRDYALYDLRTDPGETRDLLEDDPGPETERIAGELAERLAASVPAFERPAAPSAPIDPELEKRLEELGYLE